MLFCVSKLFLPLKKKKEKKATKFDIKKKQKKIFCKFKKYIE